MDYPELAAVVGANVPNYQGMFLRGYGGRNHVQNNGSNVGNTTTSHWSGGLGQIQGDATRPLWGFIGSVMFDHHMSNWGDPAKLPTMSSGGKCEYNGSYRKDVYEWRHKITWDSQAGYGKRTNVGYVGGLLLASAQQVPTAGEERPVNVAVKYIIYAKE